MKYLIRIFFVVICVACGPKDDDGMITTLDPDTENPNGDNGNSDFLVSFTAENTALNIDERTTLTISGNEFIDEFDYSFDNFSTFETVLIRDTSSQYCLSFRESGNKILRTRSRNLNGVQTESSINFTVSQGNDLVKIKSVKVNKFLFIDETWDDEFPDTDENKLADVYLVFVKDDCFESLVLAPEIWHLSEVKINQGDLTYDMQNANLITNFDTQVYIDLRDLDGDTPDPNSDDALTSLPNDIPMFKASDYSEDKPTTIILTPQFNNEWELELEVEWL